MAKSNAHKAGEPTGTDNPQDDAVLGIMNNLDSDNQNASTLGDALSDDDLSAFGIPSGTPADEDINQTTTKPEPQAQAQTHKADSGQKPIKPRSELSNEELIEANKRSEAEGKRLYGENKELKAQLADYEKNKSLIDAFHSDPGLVDVISDYYSGRRGQTAKPSDLKTSLGLPDDFEFNPEEADNPNTPSGRYLNALVEQRAMGLIDNRLGEFESRFNRNQQERQQVERAEREKVSFLGKHPEMSEAQYDQMLEDSKRRPFTVEDLYFVMNRDNLLKNVTQNAAQSARDQLKTVQSRPRSLSATSSTSAPVSREDALLEMMKPFTDPIGIAEA